MKNKHYISFESALSFYGVLEDVPYLTTIAAVMPKNSMGENVYYQIPKKHCFGFKEITINGNTCLMATPEKAFLDLLHRKRQEKERVDLSDFDLGELSKRELDKLSERMGFDYKDELREYLKVKTNYPKGNLPPELTENEL